MSEHSDRGEETTLGRKTPSADLPRKAVVFRWVVGLGGMGLLGGLLWFRPPVSLASLGMFLAAAVIADVFFRIRVAPGAYYSFTPAYTFVYALLGGGIAAALLEGVARGIAWVVGQFRPRKVQTPLFALFNVGAYIISVLAGEGAVRLTMGSPSTFFPVYDSHAFQRIGVFAAGYLIANVILSSAAVVLRTGMSELVAPGWRRIMLWSAVSVASAAVFAVILWELAQAMPLWMALVVVSLLMAGIATMLRLNTQLRTGNEDLLTINRIGQLLSSTLEISEIFRILARETRTVIPWDGFFVATRQPDEQVQITFMSREGEEIAQRTIEARAGLTGRAMETGEAILHEREEGSKNISVEDTIRGRRRPRSMIVAPMMFGREALGAISAQSFQGDVYGQQQKQVLQTIASQAATALRNAQLLRSEQQAIAERDEFLSLTTHEIKNPLTSVRGYLEIADAAILGGRADEARESLAVVRGEAQKIQRFAEDLLEVSRIGGGKFNVRFEDIDFAKIVSDIVHRYADTSEQEITLSRPENFPTIWGDETRLGQVVENLVSNAVKYSPEASRIEIELQQEGERVLLRVRDEGIGIPEAQLSLVFERFYRVEEAGQTIKGTGLGLFISREIVRMHGGSIQAESTQGRGSTFTVDLPIRQVSGRRERQETVRFE